MGNRTVITDANNHTTRYGYNSAGYSDYSYVDGTDWLLRETWHSAISGNAFPLASYWYANGRPLSTTWENFGPSDMQVAWGYANCYIMYNWHGDGYSCVDLGGIGVGGEGYNPWGVTNDNQIPGGGYPGVQYYRWNGGWGYMVFPTLGMYYVHGRWYDPFIGRFISPDASGSYIYFGDDPVNKHADAPPPKASLPSACLGGMTNEDPRDLTCWLFQEMKHNLDDPRLQAAKLTNVLSQINPFLFPDANYVGAAQFYSLVAHHRAWDFKHKILEYLGPGITLCQTSSCQNNVEFSVPGNIHYGFVAREAGYSAQITHAGAGIAEIFDPSHKLDTNDPNYTPYGGKFGCTSGSWCFGPFGWSMNLGDEPQDHQAVQFGIMLYDKFSSGRALTFPIFQMELNRSLGIFASRSPDRRQVDPNIAQDWPYWPGYFDLTKP